MILHTAHLFHLRFRDKLVPWFVVVLLAFTALPAAAQAEATLLLARIEHPQPAQLSAELEGAGYDVLEGSVTDSSFDVVVSGSELEALRASGLQIIEIDSGRPLQDILPIQDGRDDIPTGYLDLDGINNRMSAIAAAFPAIAQMVDLTTTYDVPATAEGRHLYALVISDNADTEEDEPAMLIVSNHHAREIVTPVIALDAMDRLTQGYGNDARITSLVDNNEIWIAPTWNPDGYNHVVTRDNMWRKNRRRFNNGIGVDQNRNYPQGWNNGCSGSTSPGSNTYKGPSPASEAETQTMLAWSRDQRFAKVIDYHSSGREVLSGYSCSQHPFASWLRNQASGLATASGYSQTRAPSADGEHYQWQLAQMGAWSFLIETATQFQPSFNSARQESNRVWPGILYALERPISLSGHVTDALTGNPLQADIELLNINFRNGESNGSGGPFGRYHVFARPDTYELQFSAAGYQTEVQTVTIASSTESVVLDVELQPEVTLPTISISVTDATATEADQTTATLSIQRTGDTSEALTVNYTVGGTATPGSDYQPLSGSVMIAAGQPIATISVVPIDDDEVELDEAVILSLSRDNGYRVGTPATATVTIISDEAAPPSGSDLIVSELSGTPGYLLLGSQLSVGVTTANQGSQPAANTWTRVVLSTDMTIDESDTKIGAFRVGALTNGANNSQEQRFTILSSIPEGEYYLGAIADRSGRETEAVETNNTLLGPPLTLVQPVNGVDLVVSALSGTRESSATGDALNVTVTTMNQGTVQSVNTFTRLVLSTDMVFDIADTKLGAVQVGGLVPGARRTQMQRFSIPTDLASGTYYLGAISDRSGRQPEADETNNTRRGPMLTVPTGAE